MTDRKKRRAGTWIACILLVILTLHFFVVSVSVSAEIPQVLEYDRSRLSQGITFESYENLPNETYRSKVTVCSELSPTVIDGIGEVRPVLTNENYFSIYGVHVGGSSITAEQVDDRIPAIVISDQAARRMLLDANVVGKTVSLFDREFTVVGVYKKQSGFLREISSDIYDRVYIPYTCFDDYKSISIDSIAVPKGSYSKKALPLMGMTETDTSFYFENDLAVKHDIIANLPNLLIALLAVILIVIALRCTAKIVRQTRRKLKDDYQSDYFLKVIRKNWLYLLLRILAVILMIGIPVALLLFFPPRLVLPLRYIPTDNIFDIKYYLHALKNTLQITHTDLWCGSRYYANLFWISGTLCCAEFIVLSAVFCFCSGRLYRIALKLTDHASVGHGR